MAKRWTPAMEKVAKKKAKEMARNNGKEVKSTPTKEAWKRLIRNKYNILSSLCKAQSGGFLEVEGGLRPCAIERKMIAY